MKKLFLGLCLVLASCGGKSSDTRVRLAVAGTGLQMYSLPITLAHSLGYYREEGINVELENVASLPKMLQALIGGSVDVAGLSYLQNIQMAAEGQRTRSFFVSTRRAGTVIAVSPAATERIRRAEDLRGALIGVASAGAVTHLFTNYYLGKHGVRPSEFRTASIGMGGSAIAAIESGRVDAACLAGGDHFRLLQRHPKLRILVDTSTPEAMREIYGGDMYATGTLSAKQDWLDRNPDSARRLARAGQRALQWLATHTPEEIRAKLPQGFRSEDEAIDLQIIRWGMATYTADGRMPKGAPETAKRFLDATVESVRDAKMDLAATWTDEYLAGAK